MAHRRHGALTIAIASLVLALLPGGVIAADPQAAKPSDFNGDGYIDLAIGVPREDSDGQADSGAVNVLYGSATGLTAAGDQLWSLGSPDIPGTSDSGGAFGTVLASADFDRDGYADLAVVAPGDVEGTIPDTGSVTIIRGSSSGLTGTGARIWTESDLWGFIGSFEYGGALAAGDYDGDGYPDLAIGVKWREVTEAGLSAGGVDILFGGPDGLTSVGAMQLSQDTPGVPGELSELEHFGASLTAGDFSGDGIDDLAIGVPQEVVSSDDDGSGGVNVLYGTIDGPTGVGSQLFTQATPGIGGTAEVSDYFGYALATGDFDRDGFGDLAIGSTRDSIGSLQAETGSVTVLYGSAAGLTASGSDYWHQGVAGVPGSNEDGDSFGAALAAGDFDSDGADDLAIGAPGEDIGRISGAGVVTLLYGSGSGLRSARSVTLSQNSPGVPGSSEWRDAFGAALAAGNFGRSGRDDLAVGAFHEDIKGMRGAGVVDVLYGRLSGLNGTDAQAWYQDSSGVKGTAQMDDHFGGTLAR